MNNQEQNREALIRHIADLKAVIRRRNEQIETQARNARETQRALEEIARERDEARSDARLASERWRKELTLRNEVADELRRLRAAESRPLTPDAITDEMVERGAVAAWREDISHPDWAFEDISDEDQAWYRNNARAVLTAALTVPTRPEGAEGIEALIRDLLGSHPGDWYGDLADHLAARLTDPTIKEA